MKNKTILVVEDNDLNMKLVQALLRRDSYRVLASGNAEKGLDLARSEKPDLILMDLQLPGMDGLSAIRILKKDPLLKQTPIAALTAYAMAEDLEKAREAGCDCYITKPFDIQSFAETIRKLLEEAPSASSGNPEQLP